MRGFTASLEQKKERREPSEEPRARVAAAAAPWLYAELIKGVNESGPPVNQQPHEVLLDVLLCISLSFDTGGEYSVACLNALD